MKKLLLFFSVLVIGMLVTSCQIEEIPQPDSKNKNIIIPKNPPGCGFGCPG